MSGVTEGLSHVATGVSNWAKQPFTATMDLTGWILFVGLILALAISWNFVLKDVKGVLP